MRVSLLILAVCLGSRIVSAEDHSQVVVVDQKDSTSPNKHYFVSLEQSIDDEGAGCSLQIRSSTDRKVLAEFDWEQFFEHASPDGAVKWTPNSRAFCISGLFGRGWSGSRVYYQLPSGSWTEIEIPIPDTGHPTKDGWETKGKGGYCAERWISNEILIMDYLNPTYQLKNPANAAATNVFDADWAPSHYSVSLHLASSPTGKPAFKQIDVHELPDK
jgi:hypothetical protein